MAQYSNDLSFIICMAPKCVENLFVGIGACAVGVIAGIAAHISKYVLSKLEYQNIFLNSKLIAVSRRAFELTFACSVIVTASAFSTFIFLN